MQIQISLFMFQVKIDLANYYFVLCWFYIITFVGKDVNAIISYCQKLAFNVHIFLTLRPYLHEHIWIKKSYFLFCNSFFIYIIGILYKCISKNTPITLCSIFSSVLSFFFYLSKRASYFQKFVQLIPLFLSVKIFSFPPRNPKDGALASCAVENMSICRSLSITTKIK